MTKEPKTGLFIKFNTLTIIAVYFLILVGGIVRSTGSGMGCPDWPKCFGSYIPPTTESELPEDYKERYAEKRMQKNERLAGLVRSMGFPGLANDIRKGKNVEETHGFNFARTWTEYVNRLVGVAVGFLIIICTVLSYSYIHTKKRVFFLSVAALLLVIFQGWIGSLVVSTNLLPGMITFHMILAIGLIALLLKVRVITTKERIEGLMSYKPYKVRRLLVICMVLFFAQILMGTQVREAIDSLALSLGENQRFSWIENLGIIFYMHRSYSLILLVLHAYLIYRLTKSIAEFKTSKYLVWGLLVLVVAEILTGAVLANFALPYVLQPIHLLLALMIFGIQYFLYLIIKEKEVSAHQLTNG
ncbi:cytochrome c oxidase assembly protein subunit 15 [Reichenbachiella faecimaris]|uniref:Cytochrome c oxidase assembly protein subunit 15 n=1 Tax=Reichenbachiella faecimaris TaxID=692418 RepID=A0A1W2G941_REIFA|nr:COX15/CtaA family protein [Reichenbachiella faecimaris]SMD33143.1 cytochrome c oxidase assembly protein subunit 15 [Reichenbachiella faecimaris]